MVRRTDPREVEGDLLAEVAANVVQRLVLVPSPVARPVLPEDLPRVQRLGVHLVRRQLVGALQCRRRRSTGFTQR